MFLHLREQNKERERKKEKLICTCSLKKYLIVTLQIFNKSVFWRSHVEYEI